jgi:hypothetical protein
VIQEMFGGPEVVKVPDVAESRGAVRGNNVETLHPVEIKHAYIVFSFHRMQSFHANRRSGPDGPAAPGAWAGAWASREPRLLPANGIACWSCDFAVTLVGSGDDHPRGGVSRAQ